jgi:prepilin-type N-terminal cleavage/methylation domain-containing protein
VIRRSSQRAFTLIELMIVVAIIGILASAAIPSYSKYVRKARTVEATLSLRQIADGAKLYFMTARVTTIVQRDVYVPQLTSAPSVGALPATVPAYLLPESSAGYTPSETHANVCAQNGGVFEESYLPQFGTQPWKALLFQPAGKFRYRYAWLLAQQSTSTKAAVAYAHALGDLNCDGRYAVWRMFVTELRSGSDQVLRVTGPAMFHGVETD